MHSNNCLKEVKISFLSQWRPAWVKKDVTSLLCSFYRLPGRNHQFSTRNPSLLTHHLQSVGSPECIGRIEHTTWSRKKFQVQKFEILNKTKWLFTFLHHYVSFGSFLVFPFLCADFFCVFYVWSWTFRYC